VFQNDLSSGDSGETSAATQNSQLPPVQKSEQASRVNEVVMSLLQGSGMGALYSYQYWQLLQGDLPGDASNGCKSKRELKHGQKVHRLLTRCLLNPEQLVVKNEEDTTTSPEMLKSLNSSEIKKFVAYVRQLSVKLSSEEQQRHTKLIQNLHKFQKQPHDYRIRLVTIKPPQADENPRARAVHTQTCPSLKDQKVQTTKLPMKSEASQTKKEKPSKRVE
jgi:hypothetical protein